MRLFPRLTWTWLALVACAVASAGSAAPAPDSLAAAAPADESFPVVLGSFTTTLLGSREARTQNIRLAAAALDGVVLEPGDVLSFNTSVGARTAERGYRPAPVILREARQVQLGGGVCQAATTVFVAGLLAGLDVTERWRHSSPVDYVAPGEDATIAWGVKDMRLKNTTGQRVRLTAGVTGATLWARWTGERPSEEAYEVFTQERELPAEDDAAAAGREVELFRVRRDARGGEERTLVHRDVIPPSRTRERPW